MAAKGPDRKVRYIMRLKKAGIITKIIILIIIAYAAVTLVRLQARTAAKQEEQDEMRQMVTDIEVANAEKSYAIEHSDDPDVIADIARKELDMIGSDEKVYYESEG